MGRWDNKKIKIKKKKDWTEKGYQQLCFSVEIVEILSSPNTFYAFPVFNNRYYLLILCIAESSA